jgi:hypothetical protein
LREHVAEFGISFDYMTEAVIDYATGDERTSAFVRRFAEMGEPWNFGVDDLEELAGEVRMMVLDKVRLADLHRRYWPNRPLDSMAFFRHYSICTLAPESGR